jgi:YafQ family addiction module toxin component
VRNFLVEERLERTLKKVHKKDRVLYESALRKMQEIVTCDNVDHYKNLRSPLQDFKRVHVKGCFVLLFKFRQSDDTVVFYDLAHHDEAYAD